MPRTGSARSLGNGVGSADGMLCPAQTPGRHQVAELRRRIPHREREWYEDCHGARTPVTALPQLPASSAFSADVVCLLQGFNLLVGNTCRTKACTSIAGRSTYHAGFKSTKKLRLLEWTTDRVSRIKKLTFADTFIRLWNLGVTRVTDAYDRSHHRGNQQYQRVTLERTSIAELWGR